jgi:hypothetical protein
MTGAGTAPLSKAACTGVLEFEFKKWRFPRRALCDDIKVAFDAVEQGEVKAVKRVFCATTSRFWIVETTVQRFKLEPFRRADPRE